MKSLNIGELSIFFVILLKNVKIWRGCWMAKSRLIIAIHKIISDNLILSVNLVTNTNF